MPRVLYEIDLPVVTPFTISMRQGAQILGITMVQKGFRLMPVLLAEGNDRAGYITREFVWIKGNEEVRNNAHYIGTANDGRSIRYLYEIIEERVVRGNGTIMVGPTTEVIEGETAPVPVVKRGPGRPRKER